MRAPALILAAALLAPSAKADERAGTIVGQAVFVPAGGAAARPRVDLSRIVVYLVPEGHALDEPAPKERPAVAQRGMSFQPDLLVVARGQTVEFPNDDNVDHNIFSFSRAKKFDLGIYPKGAAKAVTFEETGPVFIFCSVHEMMSGVVYVAPNRFHALTDREGRFVFKNVPIGRYAVRTWHTALPEGIEYVEVQKVYVESGRPVQLTINLAEAAASGSRP